MPLHDFRCPGGHVTEALVSSSQEEIACKECGDPAKRVFLSAPKLDWSGMAMGENASPEFVDRFEKSRKQQLEREKKSLKEHGDYGPSPGA